MDKAFEEGAPDRDKKDVRTGTRSKVKGARPWEALCASSWLLR